MSQGRRSRRAGSSGSEGVASTAAATIPAGSRCWGGCGPGSSGSARAAEVRASQSIRCAEDASAHPWTWSTSARASAVLYRGPGCGGLQSGRNTSECVLSCVSLVQRSTGIAGSVSAQYGRIRRAAVSAPCLCCCSMEACVVWHKRSADDKQGSCCRTSTHSPVVRYDILLAGEPLLFCPPRGVRCKHLCMARSAASRNRSAPNLPAL